MYIHIYVWVCVCVCSMSLRVSAPVVHDVCRSMSAHHVTSCSFAAVLALLAAVSARVVACVSVAAILATFRSRLGPLQPFRLHASTVLFAAAVSTRMSMVCLVLPCCLGLEGSVLLHVMSLELDFTCSSGRSLCVLLARHVLACVARHVTACGHVLELISSSCNCSHVSVLLWCRWCEQTEASAIFQLVIRSLYRGDRRSLN